MLELTGSLSALVGPCGSIPVLEAGDSAMSISRMVPPLEYLRAASRTSLQSFELARLNHAANLKREIAALIDQWIQEISEAMLARWLLDHHKCPQFSPRSSSESLAGFDGSPAGLFPDSHPPSPDIVPAPPRFADSRIPMKGSIGRKPQKQRQSAAS